VLNVHPALHRESDIVFVGHERKCFSLQETLPTLGSRKGTGEGSGSDTCSSEAYERDEKVTRQHFSKRKATGENTKHSTV